jgi:hypothetical protein
MPTHQGPLNLVYEILRKKNATSRLAVGPTQPPEQWVTRSVSPGVKRPGHEAHHSPPSSAEVNSSPDIPPLANVSSCHSA